MTTNDEPLGERERAALRAALGQPSLRDIRNTVEELEHQVALEDLIVTLVESSRETIRAFFDILVQIDGAPQRGARHDHEARED